MDDVLSQAGLSRRVAVIVPTHAAAAFLILSARLTGIIAGFAARQIASDTGVRSYEIPAVASFVSSDRALRCLHE
jgi:hypothetical protein